MRFSVTITADASQLGHVLEMLSESGITDLRVSQTSNGHDNGKVAVRRRSNRSRPLQDHVLRVIKANPGITSPEVIQASSDMTPSAIYATLTGLAKRKLVTRKSKGGLLHYFIA